MSAHSQGRVVVPEQSWAVRNSLDTTPSLVARRGNSLTTHTAMESPHARGVKGKIRALSPPNGPGPLWQGHKQVPAEKGSLSK